MDVFVEELYIKNSHNIPLEKLFVREVMFYNNFHSDCICVEWPAYDDIPIQEYLDGRRHGF